MCVHVCVCQHPPSQCPAKQMGEDAVFGGWVGAQVCVYVLLFVCYQLCHNCNSSARWERCSTKRKKHNEKIVMRKNGEIFMYERLYSRSVPLC